jgi:hypothetical protein
MRPGGGALHFENHSAQLVKNNCSRIEEKPATGRKIGLFSNMPTLTTLGVPAVVHSTKVASARNSEQRRHLNDAINGSATGRR